MLYLYEIATQPHFTPAIVIPPPFPGGGSGAKERARRGGLLHEDRYFAANETAAAAPVANAINESHPNIVLPHANHHEDEEIILLYMASLYGI